MLNKISSIELLPFLIISLNANAFDLAITVDDVPFAGTLPSSTSGLDVAKQMIATFKKHQTNDVQAMIIGYKAQTTESARIMNEWTTSGFQLANHSYSHKKLVTLTINAYINDIFKNEAILEKYAGTSNFRYFRYPYLLEGENLTKRNDVRKWLFANGYKVAHVMLDQLLTRYEEAGVHFISLAEALKDPAYLIDPAYVVNYFCSLSVRFNVTTLLGMSIGVVGTFSETCLPLQRSATF